MKIKWIKPEITDLIGNNTEKPKYARHPFFLRKSKSYIKKDNVQKLKIKHSEMEVIYYSIFYDIGKPKNIKNAMYKKVDSLTFQNLTDDNGIKTVELKDSNGLVSTFKINSVSTFKIQNSIECSIYVICYCELSL